MSSVFLYLLLWSSFGLSHSLLANQKVQSRVRNYFGRTTRLAYNAFATLHLLVVLTIGRELLSTASLRIGAPALVLTMHAVSVLGILLLGYSLTRHDLAKFAGLKQIFGDKERRGHEGLESLRMDGINGWVRHPLYSGLLLFVWGRSLSQYGFWTALFATLYLLIGIRFEERKLVHVYGQDYLDYQKNVSMLVPFPKWKLT